MIYRDTRLFINGHWRDALSGKTLAVINPATEEEIGRVASADADDLAMAVSAAEGAFSAWRSSSPLHRSEIMRRAAELLRQRSDAIAAIMTAEQGKPIAEAKVEIAASAEILEWFAEEGRRTYGRIIPSRFPGVDQLARKEAVGPVAAFTPWNFPISQAVRKIGAALAAGCTVVIKPPEETPASPAELIRALHDAGLPDGVINVVFGVPAEISSFLIAHPAIRKVSFTGSTAVGKQLAALAGQHMKRVTMELGGHAPAIVFDDADIDRAAAILATGKYRNAGQVCIAPTRFLVHRSIHDQFVERFVAATKEYRVGNGADRGVTVGALANPRRQEALCQLTEDAIAAGAELVAGGRKVGNKGFFFEPTVLLGVPTHARAMNEEPFGPLAMISRFEDTEQAISEANRLAYGLAAYCYTRSRTREQHVADRVEAGMLSINHYGLALAELPFGGIKDSGYGSEGGSEAVEAYLTTKFISRAMS